MLKKIVLSLLCVLPFSIFAQDVKLGHVDFEAVVTQMPEIAKVKLQMDTLQNQWENTLVKMREEHSAKIKELQDKQSTMPQSIQEALLAEIQEIENRISTFQQQAYTDLQKKQKEAMAPIIEKVRTAIKAVGTENKLTYVFDLSTQNIVYMAPTAFDITPLVKKKLGLK